jgi:NADPH:quinone reductase
MEKTYTSRTAVLENYETAFRITEKQIKLPGSGQVLVKILASGTNPLDLKIRDGKAPHAKVKLPAVLGIDLAGVVEAVGPEVKDFIPGDEVYGMTGGVGNSQGSLAEYALVDHQLLAKKPGNFTMKEAAAVPLIFITAWEGLVDRAHVSAGQKILIHGGAGGVGHMAIQIAKKFGAEIFTTVSATDIERVEKLGAIAIDRNKFKPEQYIESITAGKGFDIVYDTVGGTVLDQSFHLVKRYTGQVISCLGWGEHNLSPLSFLGASYSGVFTLLPLLTGEGRAHHGEILSEATKMAEANQLNVFINPRKFTLDNLEEAHELLASGSKIGKIVIDIIQPPL